MGDSAKVLFHPQAVHSVYAEGPPDPADFTIRAPFPTVHLLRSLDGLGVGVKGLVDVLYVCIYIYIYILFIIITIIIILLLLLLLLY